MKKAELNLAGTLYGVAVGDALGAPVEFMGEESIKRQYGKITTMKSGGWMNVEPGEVTDDTQMTLCVARGITENPDAPVEAIGREFIRWIESRPKDVGSTCAGSIFRAIDKAAPGRVPTEAQWMKASEENHRQLGGRSGGNGSLMRTAYVGMYYEGEEATKKAYQISRMTHWDEEAGHICSLYSWIISTICDESLTTEERYYQFFQAIVKSEYNDATEEDFRPRPTGYVVDSFKAAIWAIVKARRTVTIWERLFREAVENAVNLGGDADTIGAITGGLAGAICGIGGIPYEWLIELNHDVKETMNTLIGYALKHSIDPNEKE